jgi:MOSC domain-containing protein YiiM
MRELREAAASAGGGLAGDNRASPRRGITLLSQERWRETIRDLGADIPWHARRANVLVEGLDLAALIGKYIRLGEVQLEVLGETEPCSNMDRQHPGLRRALMPDCRGGVHGRVITGGRMQIDDRVEVIEEG